MARAPAPASTTPTASDVTAGDVLAVLDGTSGGREPGDSRETAAGPAGTTATAVSDAAQEGYQTVTRCEERVLFAGVDAGASLP